MRLSRFHRCLSKLEYFKSVCQHGATYGYGDPDLIKANSSRTVVVEYSSPNIAKPFHIGHLRSTVLGQYIGNIYERHGWKVIRLNYLGDWGNQFGLLLYGYQKYGDHSKLETDPLHHLFEIYVKINQDVETERKSGERHTAEQGLELFTRLENGDRQLLEQWKMFTDISLREYEKLYKRLGVWFTEYHSESMYNQGALSLVNQLRTCGILQLDQDSRGCIPYRVNDQLKQAYLTRSNGTTLYITRDVAALLDRMERYDFERIHYVVESKQHAHFEGLTGVMSSMPGWKSRLNSDLHVKFGTVKGISTRKGNVVFLQDILDEGTRQQKDIMLNKTTTKLAGSDLEACAEELCRSAVIVQDLSQHRTKDYKFSWEKVLNMRADSGPYLQYCHARLCSLKDENQALDGDFSDATFIPNDEADKLLDHLKMYNSALKKSFKTLEPCHTVLYLFALCHNVNSAYKTCRIKGTDESVAKGYLLMFQAARIVLADGMALLGLNPQRKI